MTPYLPLLQENTLKTMHNMPLKRDKPNAAHLTCPLALRWANEESLWVK
jgi:hypothetical protein